MAETYQYPAEQKAQEQVGPDLSTLKGAITGAGAGWVMGPLGILIGAGVGIMSSRMHRGELEKAAGEIRLGYEQQDGFFRQYTNDYQDLLTNTQAVASEDIDKRQLDINNRKFQRASQAYLEAGDDETKRQMALDEMSTILDEMEQQGLLDIEQRVRAQQDTDLAYQRDLEKQEARSQLAREEILVREESQARGRDYSANKAQADEYAGFVDRHTVSEDRILARIETTLENDPNAFYDPETDTYYLPPDLRQEIRNALQVDVEGGVISGILGFLTPGLQDTAQRFADGEDLSDAELMQLLKAVNEGSIEQSQRRLEGLLPVLESQAQEIGVNPEHIRKGYEPSMLLSEDQKRWRSLYDKNWSGARGVDRGGRRRTGSGLPGSGEARNPEDGEEDTRPGFGKPGDRLYFRINPPGGSKEPQYKHAAPKRAGVEIIVRPTND